MNSPLQLFQWVVICSLIGGMASPSLAASKSSDAQKPLEMRPVVIAKVRPETLPQVRAAAAKVDDLVTANAKKHGVRPTQEMSDELFARRVYLDITGAIPNYKQIKAFLSQTDPDRRARLIDSLLNSDGYASHSYNYWGDILRLRDDTFQRSVPANLYNEWVRVSFETNKPYDKWVHEMLAAEGRAFDNPATGYWLRDSGMPLDAMNNTIRVFLGTQIGCAQCHDHPFDRWKQKEFYEMAAFNYGMQFRRSMNDLYGVSEKQLKKDLTAAKKDFNQNRYRPVLQGNLIALHDDAKKPLKLPADYQYDNGKANTVVAPRTILGEPAEIRSGESPRMAFARWLTSPENPRFTKTIVNRLWKRTFGVGLIEPPDDIKDDTIPENPALMSYLEQEMVRLKYDMKEFLRILYNTKTYQREASYVEVQPGEEYHFPAPILRRMTAEQAWDSFITLAAFHDPAEYHREPAHHDLDVINIHDKKEFTADAVIKRMADYNKESGPENKKRVERYVYKGMVLVRASELPLPRPPSHFLSQFGQSNHEQIESSSIDGSVPQALQMFNGPITHMLLEPTSMMYKNVTAEKQVSDRVNVIFLSVLSRRASTAEMKLASEEIRKHGNPGYGNVIWALVNTPEFLFVQ